MKPQEERVKRLSQKLKTENIDAALMFEPTNIRYFTDFRMNTAAHSVLMITADAEVTLLVPQLDYKRALRDCWIKNVIPFPEDTPNYLQPLGQIISNQITVLGIESDTITFHQWNFLKKLYKGKIRPAEMILAELRMVKSEDEIEIIKEAALIADQAMTQSLKLLDDLPEVREVDISMNAKYVMEKAGAENTSFEPFVMSGEDSALPRRFSTTKCIKRGELVLFDMGAIYKGYCSDITRTFSLGGLHPEQKKIFEVALAAQEKTISELKPGMTAEEVDQIARDYITEHGYGDCFPHLTGHGIGLNIHEAPIIDKGVDLRLKPNMVVTIEPGIYLEGFGAARIEDMVLITNEGCERLTHTERNLI